MRDDFEAELAMRQHLAETPGLPLVLWENDEADPPTPPYIRASFIYGEPMSPNHSGTQQVRHRMQIAVLVGEGTYTKEAYTIAQTAAERFPFNAEIGQARITGRPFIGDRYHDGAYWRLNLQVEFELIE